MLWLLIAFTIAYLCFAIPTVLYAVALSISLELEKQTSSYHKTLAEVKRKYDILR